MKILHFTKMHALGNDFMVIDGINQSISLSPEFIRKLSDRHRGIGFDQCLLIEPTTIPNTDFFYTIFNADGTEVGQCGNGARCVARFIHENKLSTHAKLRLATRTTQLTTEIHDSNYQAITATLGVPCFDTSISTLDNITFHVVDLGNPHAVIRVDNVKTARVDHIGQLLNQNPILFPSGVNVEFMQIDNKHHIKLRVFERGAGETQACGSGACAAMVCARKFYETDSTMEVELPGGTLHITWEGEGSLVSVTGNAVRVFDGKVNINDQSYPIQHHFLP